MFQDNTCWSSNQAYLTSNHTLLSRSRTNSDSILHPSAPSLDESVYGVRRMEIEIPSPSVFLKRSPDTQPTPPLRTKKPQRPRLSNTTRTRHTAAASVEVSSNLHTSVAKPKQTKSRNGCKVCKQKRLKCDETQPTCIQCQKRGVECLGYEKNYKWKQQDQTDFNGKPGLKAKRATRSASSDNAQSYGIDEGQHLETFGLHPYARFEAPLSPGLQNAFVSAAYAIQGSALGPESQATLPRLKSQIPSGLLNGAPFANPIDQSLAAYVELAEPGSRSATTTYTYDEDTSRSPTGSFSSESHSVPDFALSESDMDMFLGQPIADLGFVPFFDDLPASLPAPDYHTESDNKLELEEGFDEEVPRDNLPELNMTMLDFSPPQIPRDQAPTAESDTSSTSSKASAVTILARPPLQADVYDMLVSRFAHQTSGILSIRNGETDNPWRNLVWPLLRDSSALQHAVWSMTAFHSVYDDPRFQTIGVEQVHSSIRALNAELQTGQNRLEASLATCLTLAFSEGWDSSASTGITHLHGARALVNNGIQQLRAGDKLGNLCPQDPATFMFLCNTYIYMDVIAHLTSAAQTPDFNLDDILLATEMPGSPLATGLYRGRVRDIDPLMGCAATLFPLMGRAGKLIQKVRHTDRNRPGIISQAVHLKQQLEQWQVPMASDFRTSEDMNTQVLHSIQTAEAYRLATLLYLHQAVPEIPSDSASVLAEQILSVLATVPVTSNACIVQIFPLFVASCEVTNEEDRAWVRQRWSAMIERLRIRNVTACWKVIEEVWNRRAHYEEERHRRDQCKSIVRITPFSNSSTHPLSGRGGLPCNEAFDHRFMSDGTHETWEEIYTKAHPRTRRMTFDFGGTIQAQRATPNLLSVPSFMRRSTDPNLSHDNPEFTVRGSLHWLRVMTDLGWEVFLG